MAVTELALFRVKPPNGPDQQSSPTITLDPSILADLQTAAQAQATFSGFPVTILQCIEDPSCIYLVGGWTSPSQHLEEWIPSRQNQDLMTKLGKTMDVLWMFHIDSDPNVVSDLISTTSSADKIGEDNRSSPAESRVVAIGRHLVRGGARDQFSTMWSDRLDILEAFLGQGDRSSGSANLAKGWAIDYGVFVSQDPGREGANMWNGSEEDISSCDEFVLFTVWPSVERHTEFVQTEEFARYAELRQFMIGAEMRHARVLLEVK